MLFRREGVYHGFVYGRENAELVREMLCLERQQVKTPVLLRGASGSGKTLLLNILRRQLRENGMQVRMAQGDVYIAELMDAMRSDNTAGFHRHEQADMVLLDDLTTCLKNKYASQEVVLQHLKCYAQDGVSVILTAPCEYDETLKILYHLFPGTVLEVRSPSQRTVHRMIAYHAEKKSVSLQQHQINRIAEKSSGNGFLIEGAVAMHHFFQYAAADMIGVSAR